MTTLLLKIWLCLLIAFLLGLLLGWVLRALGCKRKFAALLQSHQQELSQVRQQENSQMLSLLAELDELKHRYQPEKGAVIQAAKVSAPEPVASISYDAGNITPKAPDLFTQAPDDKDDLKKINGIGPVFEGMLNDLGIYHFAQLASLDEENVHWIANHIDLFPDRIYTDRWVEQAAELARLKQDQ